MRLERANTEPEAERIKIFHGLILPTWNYDRQYYLASKVIASKVITSRTARAVGPSRAIRVDQDCFTEFPTMDTDVDFSTYIENIREITIRPD